MPPNFPNRPNESGRCQRDGSDPADMRTGGSLAIVQETENDGLERDDGRSVNLRALEGDLKWVDWGEEETEVLKEATVPEAAITELMNLFLSQYISAFLEYPIVSKGRGFCHSRSWSHQRMGRRNHHL